MKTFKRASAPEAITYGGREYTKNIKASHLFLHGYPLPNTGQHIVVEVLPAALKHKSDLHGQQYRPWVFIYTTPHLYRVVKVFRVSDRRQVLARRLTRPEAKRLVNATPTTSGSMVAMFPY